MAFAGLRWEISNKPDRCPSASKGDDLLQRIAGQLDDAVTDAFAAKREAAG